MLLADVKITALFSQRRVFNSFLTVTGVVLQSAKVTLDFKEGARSALLSPAGIYSHDKKSNWFPLTKSLGNTIFKAGWDRNHENSSQFNCPVLLCKAFL